MLLIQMPAPLEGSQRLLGRQPSERSKHIAELGCSIHTWDPGAVAECLWWVAWLLAAAGPSSGPLTCMVAAGAGAAQAARAAAAFLQPREPQCSSNAINGCLQVKCLLSLRITATGQVSREVRKARQVAEPGSMFMC